MFKTETLIRSLIIAALTAVAAGASPVVADVRLNYDTGIDARATANGIAALNVRPNAPSKVPAEMARLFPASHRAESLRFFNNALRKYPKRAEALQITNPYNVAEAFYYATYQAYRLYNGQVPTTLPDIYATRWKILPAFGRMGWLVDAPESTHRTLFDRYVIWGSIFEEGLRPQTSAAERAKARDFAATFIRGQLGVDPDRYNLMTLTCVDSRTGRSVCATP